MNNELLRNTTFGNLCKYVAPSVFLYIFIATYGAVDMVFVGNLVGEAAISAINICIPMTALFTGLGYMIGTGGNAVILKLRGEKNTEKSNNLFNQIVIFTIGLGIIMFLILFAAKGVMVDFLGANDLNREFASNYYTIQIFFLPVLMIFCVLSLQLFGFGKLKEAAFCQIVGGISNMILDYLFMGVFEMGVSGASLATGIGYTINTVLVICFIIKYKKEYGYSIRLTKISFKEIGNVLLVGASSIVASLAMSIMAFIMNNKIGDYFGVAGLSAFGVVIQVINLSEAIAMGFVVAMQPLIAFSFGEKNFDRIKKLLRCCLEWLAVVSVLLAVVVFVFRGYISDFFFENGSEFYLVAIEGLGFISLGMLFSGFNLFVAGMFSAFSDGKTATLFAVMRGIVFVIISIYVMSGLFGGIGLWLFRVVAEILGVIFAVILLRKNREKLGLY